MERSVRCVCAGKNRCGIHRLGTYARLCVPRLVRKRTLFQERGDTVGFAAMSASSAVLVVEDDADVRRSARLALAPHVASVELIEVADARLEEKLAASTFDVVLLDMNFVAGERSGAAGLDALTRIQSVDPTLAVVLMTAYGGVSLAVEVMKKGAVDFVLKPWRNEKLIASVMAAASITQTRRKAETQQLDALERSAIERALARHAGNISLTAAALGLSRAALYRRMSKYGL